MNHRNHVSRGLLGFYGGLTKKLYVARKRKVRRRRRRSAPTNGITCKQFQDFLVSQAPVYDAKILADIRPTAGFLGYYTDPTEQAAYNYFSSLAPACIKIAEPKPVEFAAYEGPQGTFDRFRDIFPNVTEAWNK